MKQSRNVGGCERKKNKAWPPLSSERSAPEEHAQPERNRASAREGVFGALKGIALGLVLGVGLAVALVMTDGMAISPKSSDILPDAYLIPVPLLAEICIAGWLFTKQKAMGISFGIVSLLVTGGLLFAVELLPPALSD